MPHAPITMIPAEAWNKSTEQLPEDLMHDNPGV